MLIDLFIKGIKTYYLDDIYLSILFICSITMLHMTFKSKCHMKRIIVVWTIDVLMLLFLFRLCYAIQWRFYYLFETYFVNNNILYTILYNNGIWVFILQTMLLYFGACKVYSDDKKGILFVVLMVYMYVGLIADYLMPLFLVAVNPQKGESGWYINFEAGGGGCYIIAGLLLGAGLVIIYYLKIKRYIDVVLKLSSKQVKKLIGIPVISYVIYTLFSLVMQYLNIYPGDPGQLIWFIIIFALVIILYIIMYFALFYGIIVVEESSKIDAELKISVDIQNDNLPPSKWSWKNIGVNSYLKTAKEVGGDFYDYFNIDEERVAIFIADVAGHGIPAAIFMMMIKTMIRGYCNSERTPAEILGEVNRQLKTNNKSDYFVTVFLAIINVKTNMMTYCNAGHTYPVIRDRENNLHLLKSKNDFILYGYEKAVYHNYEMKLQDDIDILLYTDGITEAMDRRNKQFGTDGLIQSMKYAWDNGNVNDDILSCIVHDMEKFRSSDVTEDDITLVLFSYSLDEISNCETHS